MAVDFPDDGCQSICGGASKVPDDGCQSIYTEAASKASKVPVDLHGRVLVARCQSIYGGDDAIYTEEETMHK